MTSTNEPVDIPESATHPDYTPLLFDWRHVAALAWQGAITSGRGFVLIDISDEFPAYDYFPCTPCECHRQWFDEYDPHTELLVRIHRCDKGKGDSIYRLAGWPTPPEAFEVADIRLMGGMLQ